MLGYPNTRVIPQVSPGRNNSILSAKEASAEILCLV